MKQMNHYQNLKQLVKIQRDIHTGKVGGVKVRLLSNQEVNDDDLKIVYPLDDTLKTLPLLGEEVQLHTISGKKFYSTQD